MYVCICVHIYTQYSSPPPPQHIHIINGLYVNSYHLQYIIKQVTSGRKQNEKLPFCFFWNSAKPEASFTHVYLEKLT